MREGEENNVIKSHRKTKRKKILHKKHLLESGGIEQMNSIYTWTSNYLKCKRILKCSTVRVYYCTCGPKQKTNRQNNNNKNQIHLVLSFGVKTPSSRLQQQETEMDLRELQRLHREWMFPGLRWCWGCHWRVKDADVITPFSPWSYI